MIENLFLSVGAMKAGTTWLYEQLKDHPEIYFTPEKEVHYFANKVGIEDQLSHRNRIRKLKRLMQRTANGNLKFISENVNAISWYSEFARPAVISNDWYESLFRLRKDETVCADFSNLYCQMMADGWENVRKVADRVRVVYTLRDPFKRLWSHYKFHMKWTGNEKATLASGFDNFKDTLDQHFFWVNAEYLENYRRMQSVLNEGELMLLYFEDFRSEPEDMLSKVQNFLEIRPSEVNPEKLDKQVNRTKEFELPEEWSNYMAEKLRPLATEMKAENMWHEKWTDI